MNHALMLLMRAKAAGSTAGPLAFIGAVAHYDAGVPTSYTFSGVNIGVQSESRSVVVAISLRTAAGSAPTLPAVTIGGVSAVVDASRMGSRNGALVARATVPTGTTANIVLTGLTGTSKVHVAVYRASGALTFDSSASSVATNGSVSLTAAAGSSTVACSIVDASVAGSTAAWSGVTEVDDRQIQGGTSASAALTASTGALTIACAWLNPVDVLTIAASYH